jgi:protein disulfide-isomerase A1
VLVAYGDAGSIPQSYINYANSARDSFLFGQYTESSLPSIPESPSLPAIVLYKSFDEGYAVFPSSDVSSVTADELADFVKQHSMPLMDEISPENFGTYAEQGLPIAYLFVDPEDVSTRSQLVKDLTPLAKELKGQVNFVWIDGVKFVDHGKSLNLAGDSWPAFVIQDLAKQTKFPLLGEAASKQSITNFVNKWVKGEISPSIKSAAPPAKNDEPVFQLVADEWDQVFADESKDIFAEFFAPWCGHCREWDCD